MLISDREDWSIVTVAWVPVVLGLVAIVGGILGLRYRARISRILADGQRAAFGKAAEPIASRARPAGLIAPSVAGLVLGSALVLMGLFAHGHTP